jgi:type IX secretion system PorP/SprF family membrane protein
MKTTKYLLFTVILVAWCNILNAQLEIPLMGYNQVPTAYNPAHSAHTRGFNVHGSYQNYWMGFENAPEALNFNIFGNINDNMGFSFNVHRTSIHIFNQTQAEAGYAYRIRLQDETWLSFGLSLGVRKISALQSGNSMDHYDPILDSDLFNQSHISTGFGMSFQRKKLSIDIAAPRVFFNSDFYNKYIVMMAYDFTLNDEFQLKPVLMYRNMGPVKNDLQLRLQGVYQNQFHVEAGFGTDIFFLAGVGFTLGKTRLGYSYATLQPSYSSISGGSNSIYILYSIPGN